VTWALSAALKTEISREGRGVTQFRPLPVLRLKEAPLQEVIIVESEQVRSALGSRLFRRYAAVGMRRYLAANGRATLLRLPRRG
jgi:hypothetical protein